MPILRILPNGGTLSMGHKPGSHERAKRGQTKGWTERASRGNRDFLWSVLSDQLDGAGFAITLTIRDCPESSDEWANLRRRWVKRMERIGMLRLHWLTEWQRRGVPHLHGAIWFPASAYADWDIFRFWSDPNLPHVRLVNAWLDLAAPYGVHPRGQDVRIIEGVTGWFEYLAKHASRSVKNYQRAASSIPRGWKKTGRMWGHVGSWPTQESMSVELNPAGFFRLRRLIIRHQIAKSRSQRDYRRVRYLRNYLQTDREVSSHRALGEWINQGLQLDMVAAVAAREGVQVRS